MSIMMTAVVGPSRVTSLSSGAGGSCTCAQSSRISAAEAQAANVRIITAAATAAPRKKLLVFDKVFSSGDLNSSSQQIDLAERHALFFVITESGIAKAHSFVVFHKFRDGAHHFPNVESLW